MKSNVAGCEQLLRYCARPPFALVHRHQHDAAHRIYDIANPPPARNAADTGRFRATQGRRSRGGKFLRTRD